MNVWSSFPERDRRALVGGAVLMSVGAMWPLMVRATAWQRTQLEAVRLSGERISASSGSSADIVARARVLQTELLHGRSLEAVATSLATIVATIADSSGVAMTTVVPRLNERPRGNLSVVAVRLDATADLAGLSTLLRTLDASRHHLVVRELSVAAQASTRASALPLRCELIVETIGIVQPAAR